MRCIIGFEVNYKYYEKIDGEYCKDTLKEFKKKVGDPFEDVSLDRLAVTVMAQLARRDIWITNVDIFELQKKKISFKETKGGLVIKNKKFILNDANCIVSSVDEEVTDDTESKQENKKSIFPSVKPKSNTPVETTGVRMVYVPELRNHEILKSRNIFLTMNKKYEILKIEPISLGLENFTLHDDKGKQVKVSSENFVANLPNIGFNVDEENNLFSDNLN